MRKTASLILPALLIAGGVALAQGAAPFTRLAGQWSGSGTINLADGKSETIKCRAAYDVPKGENLQLNIRCASDSYNFELRASATYSSGGGITGMWSEATRNAAGTLSGKAEGDRFEVQATGPSFTAGLTLVTRGDSQAVSIKSRDPQASVKGASIALKRSG